MMSDQEHTLKSDPRLRRAVPNISERPKRAPLTGAGKLDRQALKKLLSER